MPSVNGPGITGYQLADRSFLRKQRVHFQNPRAAAAAIMVASVDPSTVAVGVNLTLLALATTKFVNGRKITMTLNDAGAGGLSVTVRIVGVRWGRVIQEDLTVTCTTTNDTVGTTTNVYDQLISVTKTAAVDNATGDALTMGWDGTTLGLPFPIDSITDVLGICRIANGTEQTPTAVSSTSVNLAQSAIQGLTIAATDQYIVEALISKNTDGLGAAGDF